MQDCLRSCLSKLWCSEAWLNKILPRQYDLMIAAVQRGDVQLVASFVGHVDFLHYRETGDSPLHIAVQSGHLPVVRFILENVSGTNKEDKNFYGDTPLMIATMNEHLNIVRYLVRDLGVNVNCRDNEGHTPLMAACASGNMELVEFFVMDSRVQSVAKNREGQTALHRAAFHGHVEVVRYLMRNTKLAPGQRDKRHNNCLHLAAVRLNMTCLRYILRKMVQQFMKDIAHAGAIKEDVELLLLHKKNSEGCSPLNYLVKAFNIVRDEEVDEITEADVLEYIRDKDKPPMCFSASAHAPAEHDAAKLVRYDDIGADKGK